MNAILARRAQTETDKPAAKATVLSSPNAPKKRKRIRILALAATLTLLLGLVALTVVAKSNGHRSVWDYLGSLFKSRSSDSIEVDGIIVERAGKTDLYSSMEDWIETEGVDLLYPSSLPSNARIQKVIEMDHYDGKTKYVIQISASDINMEIRSYMRNPIDKWDDYTEYQTEYMMFAVQKADDVDVNIAVGIYDGYEYYISAKNYNDLIGILDHLKGRTK